MSEANDDPVEVLTDGSCDTRSGEGGWAYHLRWGGVERSASGYEAGTTNNRMELTAAVRALEALTRPCRVEVTTDSTYLQQAFTAGWLRNWQRNGWRTSTGEAVKNQDLWQRLLELTRTHRVQWRWTRGHAGHAGNEAVDAMALRARRERRGHQSA
jgi:ribonuclease HI